MNNVIKAFLNQICRWFGGSEKSTVEEKEPNFLKIVAGDIDHVRVLYEEKLAKGEEQVDIWELLADSFTRMKAVSPSDRQMNQAWMKYFGFAVKYGSHISPVLLDWLTEENYRTIFSYAKNTVRHYMGNVGKRKTEDINLDKIDAIIQLCDYVLEKFDSSDIPAQMMKGQLLRVKGDYPRAEACFEGVMQQKNGFNGLISLLDCYNEEQILLWEKTRAKGADKELKMQLKALRKKIRDLFEAKEYELRTLLLENEEDTETKIHYMTLISKHARWERNEKNFQDCHRILQTVPEDYPEYYRIVLELAFLHQCRGNKYMPNPYYDLNKAIELFIQADQIMEAIYDGSDELKRARKSALVPLANSYALVGKYEEAGQACKKALDIDPKEARAMELLQKMETQTVSA